MKNNSLILDAKNKVLGRLASEAAIKLIGKNKPQYMPNKINSEKILIINAKKLKITGKKLDQKLYYKHSEYPGGLKKYTLKDILQKKPDFAIKNAIKGMLPKNKLQKKLLKRIKIYQYDKN